MNVVVQVESGCSNQVYDVDHSTSVIDIKAMIADREGVDLLDFSLFYITGQLQDSYTVGDLAFADADEIVVQFIMEKRNAAGVFCRNPDEVKWIIHGIGSNCQFMPIEQGEGFASRTNKFGIVATHTDIEEVDDSGGQEIRKVSQIQPVESGECCTYRHSPNLDGREKGNSSQVNQVSQDGKQDEPNLQLFFVMLMFIGIILREIPEEISSYQGTEMFPSSRISMKTIEKMKTTFHKSVVGTLLKNKKLEENTKSEFEYYSKVNILNSLANRCNISVSEQTKRIMKDNLGPEYDGDDFVKYSVDVAQRNYDYEWNSLKKENLL